jgi:hypothetical protein
MDDDRIAKLEAKVDLFERVIRTFVENPFIYDSHSFRHLLDELGYDYTPGGRGQYGTIKRRPTP